MTNTKLSLKKEDLVDVAKQYNTKKTFPMVVLLVFLMVLPSVIGIVLARPTEMYGRYYNFLFDEALNNLKNYVAYDDLNISINKDEDGYISNIKVEEDKVLGYDAIKIETSTLENEIEGDVLTAVNFAEGKVPTFTIMKNHIVYSDKNMQMSIEVSNLSYDDLYNINFIEVFDKIYLYNGYFTSFLPTMLLLVTMLSLIIIVFCYLAFGFSFKYFCKQFKLTKSEMYKLLLFNSIVPVIISFFIGLILPTGHLLFCQMMVAYNMNASIKAKDNKIIKALKKCK